MTDAAGVATCNARTATGVHAIAGNRGYTATFAGSPLYKPSQAQGALVATPSPGRRPR